MYSSFKFLNFLCLTIIIQSTLIIAQQPTFLRTICNPNAYYSDRTKFQSNLNLLLSSFSSINGNQLHNGFSDGFFNNTMGMNPNKVNGLFSCRGDVTIELCKKCVQAATMGIKETCPKQKEAITWYDECLLRYSNRSIFSVMETKPSFNMQNVKNVTDPKRFGMVLGKLMNGLVSNASISSSKFLTGEGKLNSSSKIYGLVQCTPDLSPNDCTKCLKNAISEVHACCDGRVGARFVQPSCHVRYEVYPFYQLMSNHSPAPAPSLTPTPSISPATMEPVSPPPSPPVPSMNPTPSIQPPSPAPSMNPSTSSIQPPSSPPSTNPTTSSIQAPSPPPSTNPTPTNDMGKNSCNIVLTIIIPLVIALI